MHRILIVDDEDDIREVAALSLEATANWTVLTASSGRQAIAVAAAEHPEAILMDVMMPGMDGPTTFKHLRGDPLTEAIPVVLLTAKVQGVDQRRFAGLGVAGILFKPFDPLNARLSDRRSSRMAKLASPMSSPAAPLLAHLWQKKPAHDTGTTRPPRQGRGRTWKCRIATRSS